MMPGPSGKGGKHWNVGDILGRSKEGFRPLRTDEGENMLDDDSDSEVKLGIISQYPCTLYKIIYFSGWGVFHSCQSCLDRPLCCIVIKPRGINLPWRFMHLSLKRRIYREKFYIIAFMDYITSTKYFKIWVFTVITVKPFFTHLNILNLWPFNILSKSLNNCFLAFTFYLNILYINVKFYIFICCEIYLYLSKLSFLSVWKLLLTRGNLKQFSQHLECLPLRRSCFGSIRK